MHMYMCMYINYIYIYIYIYICRALPYEGPQRRRRDEASGGCAPAL